MYCVHQLSNTQLNVRSAPLAASDGSSKFIRAPASGDTGLTRHQQQIEVGLLLKSLTDLSANSSPQYVVAFLKPAIAVDIEAYFDELTQRWLSETRWVSSISRITAHPSFAEVVDLGQPAAKIILQRMRAGEVHPHWFPALKDIVGHDPVPVEMRGRVAEMARAWVQWGEESGKI